MPRDLSSTIRSVLDSQSGETHDLVEITLPATGPFSAVTIYCGGRNGLTVGGQLYLPVLRGISQIKMSLGGNSDAGEVTLENVSQTFGATISDPERSLDGSKIVIKRAFMIDSAGTYEAQTLFQGVVEGVRVNQELVSLQVVSDMSQRNAKIANEQITQRCILTFNTNGSGVGPRCGWRSGGPGNPISQPGDPLTCDHIFESGCAEHDNQHRFGGVPVLVSQEVVASNPPVIGDGNGYDGYTPPGYNFDPDYRPWRNTPMPL